LKTNHRAPQPVPPAGQLVLIKDGADTAAQFIGAPLNLSAFSATNDARGFTAIIYDPATFRMNNLDGFQNGAAISPMRRVDHNAVIHFTEDGAVR
jgi:hypothetical protein